MKQKYIFYILFILLFSACISDREEDTTQPERGFTVVVGQVAPDIQIEFLDGTTSRLSLLRGKVVMLQFLASWCSVCQKTSPIIEKTIWQKYKTNPDFVLIGICKGENYESVLKFTKTYNITYPMTPDVSEVNFRKFAEVDAGVTRNVLIGKDGKIAFLTRLYDENEFTRLNNKIEELLAK